jgi:site-specific DNA-methyltransferase (adenine-specific)
VLRKHIKDETIDLCYIDPPFNSKRTYNQIYNNVGTEDRAQAQAFVDTWTWDDHAITCFEQILANENGVQTQQSIELMRGLDAVLGRGSLFAYLVNMTVRVAEIRRALKPTGSFWLHCDPTASHYLKLVLDSIFCPQGGDIRNEIIWHYRRWTGKAKKFQELHDTVFFYTKGDDYTFNPLFTEYTEGSVGRKMQGVLHRFKQGEEPVLVSDQSVSEKGVRDNDVWAIPFVAPSAKERLGYPTQKPEKLLEKIISASSEVGDVVLDAYCGCGTTVVVAERLKRRWVGIDITYQSISLVLKRLEDTFGREVRKNIALSGIPRDMKSAVALAHRQDDRVRKEFEKWAILTYTDNRGVISDKKGADRGIDGVAFSGTGKEESAKIVFQVKSGHVGRGDVAKLRGDMSREGAEMAVLITLEEPTGPMQQEAKAAGKYQHPSMGRSYDRIQVVTVREILEQGKRLEIPLSREVLRRARREAEGDQMNFGL